MRYLITLILSALWFGLHAQQKINTFHVVDSLTKKAVPSVSISIVRAKLAISTEKDGIFSIPGDLSKMRDTVIITAQGYASYKTMIHKLNERDSLKLLRIEHQTFPLDSIGKQEIDLNSFKKSDVAYYAGLHTETAKFDYLQIAQQFHLPKAGAYLKRINILRLAFNLNYRSDSQRDAVGMEVTRFRLRIYETDTLKGGPGNDLCNRVIEISNKDNQMLGINVSNYGIMIPGKSFFIAIEWMRDFTNQGYVMLQEKSGRTIQMVDYRPAIGIHPVKGKTLNIWALNLNRKWKPYTYFFPDFTDLAITAVVLQ